MDGFERVIMTDATDDLECAGLVASTYCQRHKAGRGLWPHECPECQKEIIKRKTKINGKVTRRKSLSL